MANGHSDYVDKFLAFFQIQDFLDFTTCTKANYSDFLNDPNQLEFSLMDKSSVHFRLQPVKCNHSMVVLVLSAPSNTNQRKKLRKQVELINQGM